MLMRSEREKLRRNHRLLRQHWADAYDEFTTPEVDTLPFSLSRRLATIGNQMRWIEAQLGEEVPAADKCLWCHRLPPVSLHEGYCSSQCRQQGDPNYRPARRKR